MKYLLTKDMYVALRDFDYIMAQAQRLHEDVILCVEGAYRMIDGKPVPVSLDEVGQCNNICQE